MTENVIRYASITVDVARTPDEKTRYIGTTTDGWSHLICEEDKTNVVETADTAAALAKKHWADTVFVEGVGINASVGDMLIYRHQDDRFFDVRLVYPARLKLVAAAG